MLTPVLKIVGELLNVTGVVGTDVEIKNGYVTGNLGACAWVAIKTN